ncbi:TetR-like C-terminal domain-containing protein [Alicyclobacillus sp. SO9]|uniref:TetR-like C-terminal domain-containing protein n=1 Tax=Alicyclobacillus sp. SO9 TaxID=2665646 RepID=UPI0018E778D9|nr:TetR-like C-terminal domain-containing protein [Alicyclobacillus sp. SO9]QQE77417.1 WHG domain-containing protein [Alicyclobacillus sp. SO9]
MEPEETIHVVRAFRAIGHGFATLEAADAFAMEVDEDESYQRLVDFFLLGLKK